MPPTNNNAPRPEDKAPAFRPLPKLGGTREEILARSPLAKEIEERIRLQIEAEKKAGDALRTRDRELKCTLSAEQLANWRKVLFNVIGPYALLMSNGEIQGFRDRMQARTGMDFDKLGIV